MLDYASWNVRTLEKVCRVFTRCGLHISFETYSSLIGDTKKFVERALNAHHAMLIRAFTHLHSSKTSTHFNDFHFNYSRTRGSGDEDIDPISRPACCWRTGEQSARTRMRKPSLSKGLSPEQQGDDR